MSSEAIMAGAGPEMSPEEKELRVQLRNKLYARGIDLYDHHRNGCRAIPITEAMLILLENGDDILNLANEILSFRGQDKYSCAGCALADGDWCNADEECRRNFKDDTLPDLYQTRKENS